MPAVTVSIPRCRARSRPPPRPRRPCARHVPSTTPSSAGRTRCSRPSSGRPAPPARLRTAPRASTSRRRRPLPPTGPTTARRREDRRRLPGPARPRSSRRRRAPTRSRAISRRSTPRPRAATVVAPTSSHCRASESTELAPPPSSVPPAPFARLLSLVPIFGPPLLLLHKGSPRTHTRTETPPPRLTTPSYDSAQTHPAFAPTHCRPSPCRLLKSPPLDRSYSSLPRHFYPLPPSLCIRIVSVNHVVGVPLAQRPLFIAFPPYQLASVGVKAGGPTDVMIVALARGLARPPTPSTRSLAKGQLGVPRGGVEKVDRGRRGERLWPGEGEDVVRQALERVARSKGRDDELLPADGRPCRRGVLAFGPGFGEEGADALGVQGGDRRARWDRGEDVSR